MGKVKITCLVEERTWDASLRAEHGLAVWVEAGDRTVLFDTGQSDAVCCNARMLGVDLPHADAVMLSHGHYDHTGGLEYVLSLARKARIFAHPKITMRRYAVRPGKIPRDIGIPDASYAALRAVSDKLTLAEGPVEVAPGVMATGAVPRTAEGEDTGGPFFEDVRGHRPDLIEDDQALYIEGKSGVLVLLGCAHAGVANTLTYVSSLCNGKPIRRVLGGMHLDTASPARLERTARFLKGLPLELLYPAHCTGVRAERLICDGLPARCLPLKAGTTVEVGPA